MTAKATTGEETRRVGSELEETRLRGHPRHLCIRREDNVEFDLQCMDSVINDPDWLASMTNAEIIEQAGTEGVEIIMWLIMRGAMHANVNAVHKHYHAPISNTGAGVLVLQNAP